MIDAAARTVRAGITFTRTGQAPVNAAEPADSAAAEGGCAMRFSHVVRRFPGGCLRSLASTVTLLILGVLPAVPVQAQLAPDTLAVLHGAPGVHIRRIAGAGDWTGDGRPEIGVAEAPESSPSGITRFFYGGEYLIPTLFFELPGRMYAPDAGDLNDDGFGDIVLEKDGKGAVYTGNEYGLAADASLITFWPTVLLSGLRTPVISVGDVLGDAHPDLVAGSPAYGASGSETGRAYVTAGGSAAILYSMVTPSGANAGDHFGDDVQALGDLNGDGTPDFLVTAPGAGTAGTSYVFYGGPTLSIVPDLVLPGLWKAAGDVNGDGHADLVRGFVQSGPSWRMEVLYGGATTDAGVDLVYEGPADVAPGVNQVSIGHLDANGDGYEDLAIGCDVDVLQLSPATGRVTLFLGGAAPDTTADLVLLGAAPYDYFGVSVAGLGDVDGDGRDDLGVVAAAPYEGNGEGRACVFAIRSGTLSVPGPAPAGIAMRAPWPNPASQSVHFAIDLPAPAHVSLDVLDAAGRRVARLADGALEPAGRFSVEMRPAGLRPGVYHEVATVNGFRISRRFVWLGGP